MFNLVLLCVCMCVVLNLLSIYFVLWYYDCVLSVFVFVSIILSAVTVCVCLFEVLTVIFHKNIFSSFL